MSKKFNLFDGVNRVIDLCAAPGSWSQVISKRLESKGIKGTEKDVRVISVDLAEMAEIPGVHIICGDITRKETVDKILDKFKGNRAELVVCDGAPDVTGFIEIDQYIQSQIFLSALIT